MSPVDEKRRLLPLLTPRTSGRAAVTCEYRCGNACSHPAPNTSDNAYFGDVVKNVLTRRGVLRAGAVFAAATGGALAFGGPALANNAAAAVPALARQAGAAPGTDFTPVAPNTEDAVVVADGYEHGVVIAWGDPVVPGAPAFDFDNQRAEAQAGQFGFNADFCGLVPIPGRDDAWLMVSNFEYTSEKFMFRDYDPDNPTEEQAKIAWESHGMGVVQVERGPDGGLVAKVDPAYNRRLTLASTAFDVRGPARGSKYLKTSADKTGTTVIGTQNNCAGGVTPWGTILSGEENFNQYFANGGQVSDPETKARLARYGMTGGASSRKWERFDSRYDLTQEPNEANRFGYIVEVDPLDPESAPIKHTALGRFKHEGANVIVAEDGRVVVYMGDDERFDYMYKFVTDGKYKPGTTRHARERNKRLLDSGTLYVAKFTGDSPEGEIDGSGALPADGEFDGTGEWIPLAHNDTSFVDGFTAEEVYIFTRLAADKVGPTKMDRPEDVEPNPKTGRVYAALTNNSRRGATGQAPADEANPRNGNRHGQILELAEAGDDNTATTFGWKLLLVCGDPDDESTYFAGYDKSQVSPISCPDNVAFDSYGNLWISTDGNALGTNDGLFAVPLTGAERGHVKQFLTVPIGAETCGPVIMDDLVLVTVQHPGEIDGASADNPASHWPDGGDSQPRGAVVAVWQK
ncbi:MAG: DUF839 domain-containing protein [Actinophytocola sp.]|nr:DUF839 domain-containing protein [Actinophytocola sp.]